MRLSPLVVSIILRILLQQVQPYAFIPFLLLPLSCGCHHPYIGIPPGRPPLQLRRQIVPFNHLQHSHLELLYPCAAGAAHPQRIWQRCRKLHRTNS